MNPDKLRRIASLHRELAEAYDDLAEETPQKRPARVNRERLDEASREAVGLVQDSLRKRGIKVA